MLYLGRDRVKGEFEDINGSLVGWPLTAHPPILKENKNEIRRKNND